jgi:hypothetical protein
VESIIHFTAQATGRQTMEQVTCKVLEKTLGYYPLILAYFGPSDGDLFFKWIEVASVKKEFAYYHIIEGEHEEACAKKYKAEYPALIMFRDFDKPSIYKGNIKIDEILFWMSTE